MWTGPAAEGRVSSTDSSAIMALEAGRDVVRAARCLAVMAHVGFSALNAYGPDGGAFNAGGCRGRRRLGGSAAADALHVVKTTASFQEIPGKATNITSTLKTGNMTVSQPTT